MYACDDCMVCVECGRKQCAPYPMCEHQKVCDPCFPNGCEDCIELVEADEAV